MVHRERVELEEQILAVELERSRLETAESIHDLVARLWEKDAVERLVYLAVQHERDRSAIELKRQQLIVKRKEAELEQFALVCAEPAAGEEAERRKARLEEAHRRALQADCHRIGKELAIAEIDHAYRSAVLASIRDLRENEVTTVQQVLRAELEERTARQQVDYHRTRVDRCIASGAAAGEGDRR